MRAFWMQVAAYVTASLIVVAVLYVVYAALTQDETCETCQQ